MRFKNPQNGYVEEPMGSCSGLWCFFAGPLYLFGRGLFAEAFQLLALNSITIGLFTLAANANNGIVALIIAFMHLGFNLTFATALSQFLRKYYLRRGWLEVKDSDDESIVSKNIQMDRADIALSVMQKVDEEQENKSDRRSAIEPKPLKKVDNIIFSILGGGFVILFVFKFLHHLQD